MTAAEPALPAWRENLHTTLDGASLLPVPGAQEVANGASAVLYAGEGDWGNAMISLAGLVPLAGDAGIIARLGSKAVKGARTGEEAVQERSQLGKLANGDRDAPGGLTGADSAAARGASPLPPGVGEPASGASSLAAGGATPPIKPGSAGGATAGKAFPPNVRQSALEENPSTCVYCHQQTDKPQVDHAIPKSRGGDATIDNAQTACGWCNRSKGARDVPVNPPPGYEGAWPPGWWPQGPRIR